MDLRYNIPLEAAHLVDAPAVLDDLGLENALRINPGEPDSSVVYLRMIRRDDFGMPPLASFLVDEQGAFLISEWIDSLAKPVSSEDPAPQLPVNIVLYPAYPNPFNATTSIRFYLPNAGEVSLDLYNMKGQKIVSLVEENMPSGYHTVKLEARDLASGVYVYRLRAGKELQSRKCILLK